MYAWPWIDKKIYNDYGPHNLLDRPRDKPFRTGVGVAAIIFFSVLTIACATDILANNFHIAFERLIEILQYCVARRPDRRFRHRLQGLSGPAAHPRPPHPASDRRHHHPHRRRRLSHPGGASTATGTVRTARPGRTATGRTGRTGPTAMVGAQPNQLVPALATAAPTGRRRWGSRPRPRRTEPARAPLIWSCSTGSGPARPTPRPPVTLGARCALSTAPAAQAAPRGRRGLTHAGARLRLTQGSAGPGAAHRKRWVHFAPWARFWRFFAPNRAQSHQTNPLCPTRTTRCTRERVACLADSADSADSAPPTQANPAPHPARRPALDRRASRAEISR